MVVLTETVPEELTPERLAESYRRVQVLSGMPIDSRVRIRVAPSVHACRAVVATRLRWPDREAAMLRRLRVLHFAGELLDDSDTLELAAEQAGLPVAELAKWADAPEVEEALRADMRAARRDPTGPDGERRPICPAYELVRVAPPVADRPTAARVDLPGFRPVEAYEAAIAGLAPELARRPDPGSVEEVLAWAGIPLATAEVAAVCDREIAGVRPELARVASFTPAGGDGYWSLG